MALVEVRKPGLLTTVQDQGRFGYWSQGLPRAGCMDDVSQALANWLVGNPKNQSVLEITWLGPELVFEEDTQIAVCGAGFDLFVNDHSALMNTTINVAAGDSLRFGQLHSGCRAYFAIAGGWQTPEVMGSQSTYLPSALGGFQGRALKTGDRLSYEPQAYVQGRTLPQEFVLYYRSHFMLRVLPGVEWQHFGREAREALFDSEFTITKDCDRMGYRLNSELPLLSDGVKTMVTMAVTPGTIQVPASGQPIVLMADAQTSGGYPRIANVISADSHVFAQAKPGDKIRFYEVSLSKATEIFRQKQQWLQALTEC